MGIKLDWEVESEAGWSEIGEDAAAIAARRRRAKRLRTVGLVALAIILVVGGIGGFRLYQVGRQLRADLITTVNSETDALRTGKEGSFLAVQADFNEWQRAQTRTFQDYQALGDRLQVTGKIVDVEITADQARVIVEETLDGEAYHVIWFYQRTEDGWRHVPPNPTYWGEQHTDTTLYFYVTYQDQDEALAKEFVKRVNKWWDDACRITACTNHPTAPRIRIEPDPLAKLGWASYDDHTLIIPSPELGRVRADGSFDPVLFDTVARYLAEDWASQRVDTSDTYSDSAWLRDELALYLHHKFSESAPPSGFFGPLADTHGFDIVEAILNEQVQIDGQTSLVPVLEALTGKTADQIRIDWGSYLTQRLRAESALVSRGFVTEAMLLYRGSEPSADVLNVGVEGMAEPASIQLLSTRQVGDIIWIAVRFNTRSPLPTDEIAYEPYRLIDGRWVHAWATASDWGEPRSERAPHITLTYYALDEPFVEGLAPHLEQTYLQIAADFGFDQATLRPLTIAVSPNTGMDASPDFLLSSPYLLRGDPNTAAIDMLRGESALWLIKTALADKLGPILSDQPFAAAFIMWEMERLGLSLSDSPLEIFSNGMASRPWPLDGSGSLAFTAPYTDQDYVMARTLLDVLVTRYGKEAIPTLLANLSVSANVDDWLNRSFGITFFDVEAAWHAALEASQ